MGCSPYSCVAHAGSVRTESTILIELTANYQRQLSRVQHIHGQFFDCSYIFVHLVEFTSCLAENSVTDIAEARNDESSTAIRDTNREVIGRNAISIVVTLHAALTVRHAVASIHYLSLGLRTSHVEHLFVGALGNENP